MPRNNNSRSKLIVFLTIFYLIVSAFNQQLSGASRFIPTIVLSISVLYGLFCVNQREGTGLDLIILTFWVVIGINAMVFKSYETGAYVTFIKASYWCSMFFVCRTFFNRMCADVKKYEQSIVIISLIMVGVFLISERLLPEEETPIANNGVFYPLLMLPWIVSIDNQKYKWSLLLIVFVCVLVSIKRSATIIVVLSIIAASLFDLIERRKKRKLIIIPSLVIIILSAFVLVMNTDRVDTISERFESIQEDGGSGRDEIYADVLLRFHSKSTAERIVGSGYDMVRGESMFDIPVSAHNDFLEVLYDYGYIGASLLLLMHLFLLKNIILLIRIKHRMLASYIVSYICFIVMCLVSHLIIYPTYFVFLIAYWAYVENQMIVKIEE